MNRGRRKKERKRINYRGLSSRKQFYKIKELYPEVRLISGAFKANKCLIVELPIQPTPFSCTYIVRITLLEDRYGTRVDVVDPKLVKRGTDPIPHTYPNNRLCLFQPKYEEWNSKKYIAETIIPWASLWLYYYEEWHRTGFWHGGGEHPEPNQSK